MNSPSTSGQVGKRFSISRPGAGAVVLVENYSPTAETGTIRVTASVPEASVKWVFACIVPEGDSSKLGNSVDPNNPTPLSGCFDLGSSFDNANSPVANLSPTPPPDPNMHVYISGYDASGNLVQGAQTDRSFVAMPQVVRYSVSAKHCIWLSYADPATAPQLPFQETITDEYVPKAVLVPEGVTQVLIGVQMTSPPAAWGHDPSDLSGADGVPNTERPLDPHYQSGYQNEGLGSQNIVSGTFRLNRLIGLWVYAESTTSTTEFDAFQSNSISVPSNAVSLRLGLHDGYQWSNNVQTMPVQVTWMM